MIKEIRKDQLENEVRAGKTIFARFYGKPCSVATKNLPDGQAVAKNNSSKATFYDIEIDDNKLGKEEGNEEYAIELSPTYVLYKDSLDVGRDDNFISREDLQKTFDKFVK